MMLLSQKILPSLKEACDLNVPNYDPTILKPGILHLGVGNFHRSHFATYMNDLFMNEADQNQGWGIVGGGIMSFDADKRELLESQDWLQTIVERDADSSKATIVGSMIDFLPVDHENKEHKELQEMMVNPSIKIVSLTVTEGGYYLSDGKFDVEAPDIKHDIENPESPQTIFGMMVKALQKRRESGDLPFTVMSCDNMPHNGHVTKSVVVTLAKEMYGQEMADWVEKNVPFPNSMVDRITPGTTDATRAFVKDNYGYEDKAPIFCEPFRQWVLEDSFPHGRPAWENLENVMVVEDVEPFENMKIRILNGGHASLCYPAALLGVKYVHEAMEHETIGPFLDTLERKEIIPTIPPVPETDLNEYWELISHRFSNPVIEDTIGRICFDGASRQPKFIVPTICDGLNAGSSVEGFALVSALWCRYCQGTTESGEKISPNDPQWDRLQEKAQEAKTNPSVWLGMKDVYGEVGSNPTFKDAFENALKKVQDNGVDAALKDYVAKHS
ncbi:hypothetical protein ACA910_002268 [Epithemia clementina (nom. ined.)]